MLTVTERELWNNLLCSVYTLLRVASWKWMLSSRSGFDLLIGKRKWERNIQYFPRGARAIRVRGRRAYSLLHQWGWRVCARVLENILRMTSWAISAWAENILEHSQNSLFLFMRNLLPFYLFILLYISYQLLFCSPLFGNLTDSQPCVGVLEPSSKQPIGSSYIRGAAFGT